MAWVAQNRPLITILLLCYNHERFAAEAVEGVLSQTYSPLEIIIFDDCSLDRTADVIERTLARHQPRPDVRFIRNPENMHSNLVVRLGLGMAKGEFIFVSHGDDIMLPDMVEQMARVWIEQNVSLVTANALYIDENSQSLNRTFRDPAQPADDSFETLARDGSNACCFGPAIGFERAIYEKFDWVPRYLRAYDMMYPFYAYLLKGARFINMPLIKYRVHGQNTSLSLQTEKADAVEKTKLEERMYLLHLAHALLMEEVLDRLRNEAPDRYGAVAERIMPLLTIQLSEMAKKLVRVARQHGSLTIEPRPLTQTATRNSPPFAMSDAKRTGHVAELSQQPDSASSPRAASPARICVFCNNAVEAWKPFVIREADRSPFCKKLQTVGSNVERFECPHCSSNDRERHLRLFLDRLKIMETVRGGSVLHMAPELRLRGYIESHDLQRYIRGDLLPQAEGVRQIDLQKIPFPDETFDMVICNHMLEHVADATIALREICRVLKRSGRAICQTPYSPRLTTTFEDPLLQSPDDRFFFYGQDDHVRLFGSDIERYFAAAGFVGRLVPHAEILPEIDPEQFGINEKEPFFDFIRNWG